MYHPRFHPRTPGLIIAFAAFQKPLQIGSRKPLNLSSENQADLVFQNHLFVESDGAKNPTMHGVFGRRGIVAVALNSICNEEQMR